MTRPPAGTGARCETCGGSGYITVTEGEPGALYLAGEDCPDCASPRQPEETGRGEPDSLDLCHGCGHLRLNHQMGAPCDYPVSNHQCGCPDFWAPPPAQGTPTTNNEE